MNRKFEIHRKLTGNFTLIGNWLEILTYWKLTGKFEIKENWLKVLNLQKINWKFNRKLTENLKENQLEMWKIRKIKSIRNYIFGIT